MDTVAPAPTFPVMDTAARLARFREQMARREDPVDGFLITDLKDVRYLSGFSGSAGALLITASDSVVVTDFRYRTQVGEQAADWEFIEVEAGTGLLDTIAETAKQRGVGKLAFQSDQMVVTSHQKLAKALDGEDKLVSTLNAVGALREVKDADEIAIIKRAAELADATMTHAVNAARPGVTERDLKAELEYFMVRHGAQKASFDMIIAGGPNSALCHAPITDRPLQVGDYLTIDLGALVDGYCSDLTRTFAIGEHSDEQQRIYGIVYEAQVAALAAIKPGVKGEDVDAIARDIITEAGHGEDFGHGLGHGVGLNIHEGPRLAKKAEAPLQVGNIVTNEPGIYIGGFGGVRIEDLVLVTEDGHEVLSHSSKPAELMVIG